MCLRLTRTSKVKTSKRNIVCYKVLKFLDRGVRTPRPAFMSPYQNMKYQRGKRVEVRRFSGNAWTPKYFTTEIPNGIQKVFRGFHAYTSIPRAKRESFYFTRVIVECVIPAGTSYIEGTQQEIVALALIPRKAVAGNRKAVERFNAPAPTGK